jgi:hypothetical protein
MGADGTSKVICQRLESDAPVAVPAVADDRAETVAARNGTGETVDVPDTEPVH